MTSQGRFSLCWRRAAGSRCSACESLYCYKTATLKDLTAVDARRLAAALLDAADHLDRLDATAACPRCDGDGYHPGGEDGDPIRCFHDADSSTD